MAPAPNKAPKWTLVLFFAPLAFAIFVHLLEALLQKTSRWQQLSRNENKRRSAMLALIKGVAYSIGVALNIILMVQVAATWGAAPTWVDDEFYSNIFNSMAGTSAMLYFFELAYKNVVSYDVWLHHVASVLVNAIALTGVFLAGDELQRALMASWTLCIALPTCCNAVFYLTLLAYHLQLDNFRAKMRLAIFFNLSSLFIDRSIIFIPLAYTISSWGLLTTTSKVLMLTLLCCFVPEHVFEARTMWGTYRLNRDCVQTSVDVLGKVAEMATVDAEIVTCAGNATRRSVEVAPVLA